MKAIVDGHRVDVPEELPEELTAPAGLRNSA